MTSIKSRLYRIVLRATRKKSFATEHGLRKRLEKARKSPGFRPPASLYSSFDITETTVGGIPGFTIQPKNKKPTFDIVYLHGGAFLFEITSHHYNFVAEMAQQMNARFHVAIYPLAPEHPADEVHQKCWAYCEPLLTPKREMPLVLMGDSAGANLALVMTMMATEKKHATPDALVLISPPTDLRIQNPEIFKIASTDPWLDVPGVRLATSLYAQDGDLNEWRFSPVTGNLSKLPPMQILIGKRDILYPDTTVFAVKAKDAGANVEMIVEDEMFHVWPLLNMPEAKRARTQIVDFVVPMKETK